MKSPIKMAVAALSVAAIMAAAHAGAAGENEEASPEFTAAVLGDEKNIETGREIWQEQCAHCHGSKAYPGKAPKLKPSRYKPGFVYRRVTNGFRKMPAWKDVYSRDERIAVVTYIMSREFSP